MENIFKNVDEPWSQEDDEQLDKLYNVDMLDIMEISNINNRAPGKIISRLYLHDYINNRTSARGYINYKNSDLYKKIVSESSKKNNEYKDKIIDESSNSNIGKKWTDDEERLLLEELNNNIDIEIIAQKHGRTFGSINSRLKEIACKMYRNNISIEEIIEKTKLGRGTIKHSIEKKINKVTSDETNNNNNNRFYKKKNKIEEPDYAKIQTDITEIKQYIKKLSSNMNELIDMLKSIYEFENIIV
jgi:hypothetical protein